MTTFIVELAKDCPVIKKVINNVNKYTSLKGNNSLIITLLKAIVDEEPTALLSEITVKTTELYPIYLTVTVKACESMGKVACYYSKLLSTAPFITLRSDDACV